MFTNFNIYKLEFYLILYSASLNKELYTVTAQRSLSYAQSVTCQCDKVTHI
jgi:hypothetical protein